MKQVAQRPRDGQIEVVETPTPVLRPGWILVANRFSLISAGTERSKIVLGNKNLVQKARARPDLVRKVVDKARTDGIRGTAAAVREQLGALTPLGYSSAGVVVRVGEGVEGLLPGDRVACGGGGFANHAELVAVPKNLVARVPDGVELDAAAYATVGAIALHGLRQAEVGVGDRVGVIGLGLVGQLAIRLARAAGCEPVGIDPDPTAVALAADAGVRALERGAAGLEAVVLEATGGVGLDAVLVCASSRESDPVELAARLARDRGRIVVVGEVPVAADRALMYEKELELRLSRSYGPGRYDRDYEERGRDLPHGYVRWTEQRNLQAFLELIASARLDPTPLTTHRYPVDAAAEAYATLADGNGRRPFGIVLEYREQDVSAPPAAPVRARARRDAVRIGLVGAGSFARKTLLPAFSAAGAELAVVATSTGLTAADVAARFGGAQPVDSGEAVVDADVDAVVIATRHDEHGPLVAAALRAGKSVFVEKPLALTLEEIEEIARALQGDAVLMVGFNRRYAPLTERLVRELGEAEQRVVALRVNAGPLPDDHWLHDPAEGGGRLVGEGCHFVDLAAHLAGSSAAAVHAFAVPQPTRPLESSDDVVATFRFLNGSVGTLVYSGAGDPRLPKERVEVFAGGLAATLDDFRRLELYRRGRRTVAKGAQDKGHRQQVAHFVEAVAGRREPPSAASYLAASRATLALAESLRTGLPVELV